jgi:hypothetical protein
VSRRLVKSVAILDIAGANLGMAALAVPSTLDIAPDLQTYSAASRKLHLRLLKTAGQI